MSGNPDELIRLFHTEERPCYVYFEHTGDKTFSSSESMNFALILFSDGGQFFLTIDVLI